MPGTLEDDLFDDEEQDERFNAMDIDCNDTDVEGPATKAVTPSSDVGTSRSNRAGATHPPCVGIKNRETFSCSPDFALVICDSLVALLAGKKRKTNAGQAIVTLVKNVTRRCRPLKIMKWSSRNRRDTFK